MSVEQIISDAWNVTGITGVYGNLYWLQAPATRVLPYSVAYRTGSIEQMGKDDVNRAYSEVTVQIDTYTSEMLMDVTPINTLQATIGGGKHMVIEGMLDEYIEDRDVYRKMHFLRVY